VNGEHQSEAFVADISEAFVADQSEAFVADQSKLSHGSSVSGPPIKAPLSRASRHDD
jgi:hypothetical protein